MGGKFQAKCEVCGFEFYFRDGGGFEFFELRCDRCRRLKTVRRDELGDTHPRRLKECLKNSLFGREGDDGAPQDNVSSDPVTQESHLDPVEEFAGVHEDCGGQFRFGIIPRCPKCKSDEIEVGEPFVLYD